MIVQLESIDSATLLAELKRREQVEKEKKQKIWEERRQKLSKFTREIVDLLVSEHGRTSCNDDNLTNGFDSGRHSDRSAPRCVRCALLEVVNDQYWPDDFDIERISITKVNKY